MKYAIIGAGMAGLACADVLVAAGHEASLFDKGRGPGGRISTRRIDTSAGEISFDHGAQYFTARDPDFCRLVERWRREGLAARWPEAGPDAWVGVPRMSTIVRAIARGQDVTFGARVVGFEAEGDGWRLRFEAGGTGPFDGVIIAVPAEQAATLLALQDMAQAGRALHARSQPCWTGMYAFAEPLAVPDAPVRNAGAVNWAVRNSAKPGRSGPEAWVVQAQPHWSSDHLELPSEQIAALLLAELATALRISLPEPIAAAAHRWRFAMSSGTGDEALWDETRKIGVCGDWLLGPRVECAWLSGRALGERIVAAGLAPSQLAG